VERPTGPPLGHGERVLLVDDEQAVLEITRAILIKYGYEVFSASDGSEALTLFAQHKDEIDLVLTDFMMPFLDGPATIRALQNIAPDVRIITASGLQENEAVSQQFRHVTFLSKPFTPEKLLTTIAAALKGPTKTTSSAHAEDPGH
jgi:CheY-like chemotaxis protein